VSKATIVSSVATLKSLWVCLTVSSHTLGRFLVTFPCQSTCKNLYMKSFRCLAARFGAESVQIRHVLSAEPG
jgi:hypothetical protein